MNCRRRPGRVKNGWGLPYCSSLFCLWAQFWLHNCRAQSLNWGQRPFLWCAISLSSKVDINSKCRRIVLFTPSGAFCFQQTGKEKLPHKRQLHQKDPVGDSSEWLLGYNWSHCTGTSLNVSVSSWGGLALISSTGKLIGLDRLQLLVLPVVPAGA